MGLCVSSPTSKLSVLTSETTEKFTLAGRDQPGKVVRVVDGDTVDLALELFPDQFYQFRVRLYGIDTPEKRPPKNSPNREEEIEAAKRSTEALTTYLYGTGNMVDRAVFREADKYGRWLCEFYIDGVHVNEWMIKTGHAKPYFGGKKEQFESSQEV